MVGIRQQRQQRTRLALLDAAASVFARRGYASASVPQIAQEAGMSTGAIYANFSGKHELFLAMMRRVIESGAEARQRSAEHITDRDELLEQMVTTWTSTVDAAPEIVLLMAEFWLYALRNPPHGDAVTELLADVRANLAASIVGAGVVTDPDRAERMAVAVQALAYGYAMQRLADEDSVSPAQLVESVDWLLLGAAPER
ncbi:putative transcriptional regulator, TetR family protein [Nocardiopsis kunsanensis]|uniref:Transcriptional regulator, TetR family protein n=1 Tax=Nocardiopsis kunsanensis TaxID=141693 RepID=A0A918XBN6_9ACTN|nr:TetR/AcrR family transcriptional regulator [Nocardiopsis kunsanensis]GHD21354.1 putative transcriptional regulator, TetR family protein [Nocardiopsis kunsanensis]